MCYDEDSYTLSNVYAQAKSLHPRFALNSSFHAACRRHIIIGWIVDNTIIPDLLKIDVTLLVTDFFSCLSEALKMFHELFMQNLSLANEQPCQWLRRWLALAGTWLFSSSVFRTQNRKGLGLPPERCLHLPGPGYRDSFS